MNGNKKEAIGNVVLNYKYYKGEDLYSEGESEDMLLKLVTENDRDSYPHLIEGLRSWSVMYHLSAERENICSWLPIKKTDKVLEIGAGCGAITGCLASLAEQVKCIELSRKRSLINATRHKDMGTIEILVGNFEDIEPDIEEEYDYITLIGVLEYAGSYISSPDPYREMLRRVMRHLKKDGRLIVAIENQLGLKYFAGCKEDHTARFYEGIEGYPSSEGVKTFSKRALKKLFNDTGYKTCFYYPYPDYKLPITIYSDLKLPSAGELNDNIRNFDADRLVTFDEAKVFDTLIGEGMFAEFSNSFLVVATREELPDDEVVPVFAKYSGARSDKYRVATVIYSDLSGRSREVRKLALSPKAGDHVDDIYVNYLKLLKLYGGTGFAPNACKRISGGTGLPVDGGEEESNGCVGLEYIDGMTMEDYLDRLEAKHEYERMLLLIKQYESMLLSVSKLRFENTDEFVKIFGERIPDEDVSAKLSNIDMIFTNIVFYRDKKEDGVWNVLDYEWTFDFPVPVRFIIYRALFYYTESHKGSGFLKYVKRRGLDLYEEFGITAPMKARFERIERHFQLYIIGGAASPTVLHELMPVVTVDVLKASGKAFYLRSLNNPRIYYGSGEGFSASRQLCRFGRIDGSRVVLEIPMEAGMTELRVDPTDYRSIVSVKSIELKMDAGREENIDKFLTNGYVCDEQTILFDTDDAQLILLRLPTGRKTVTFTYDVSMVDDDVFDALCRRFSEDVKNTANGKVMVDKVISKLGIKDVQVIPEGLKYNK
ncbi:MAG: class I SAM-dependent methyltransferase [Lachnospiraceae bacterium]|nr:class I SAM-dependent methyltransferase [Lachnospiraceae bacterium]